MVHCVDKSLPQTVDDGYSSAVFDHTRSGVVYNFGRVCLSDDNFRKP